MQEASGNPSQTALHRLVLVGFMGAGKTSVGRELARFLQWEFVDLDDRIEAAEKRSVREIFETEGEAYFRRVEREELQRLLREWNRNVIISVGGGAFAEAGAAEMVHGAGCVSVLLDATVEELRRRVNMGSQVRPLAQDRERFGKLYQDRSAAYAKAQHRVETTGKSVARVAHELADWIRNELFSVGGPK